LDRNSIVISMN